MDLLQVNFLAVAAAAVVGMVIAMIWYSPSVFGAKWCELACVKKEDCCCSKWTYVAAYINGFVMAYVLALFINHTYAFSVQGGLLVAFMAWLGFIATVQVSCYLWANKSLELCGINAGFWLVSNLAMAITINFLS